VTSTVASTKLIFQAIGALAERGKPFDVVTLAEEARPQGGAQTPRAASPTSARSPTTPPAPRTSGAYADIVREHSVIRQLTAWAPRLPTAATGPRAGGSRSCSTVPEQKGLRDRAARRHATAPASSPSRTCLTKAVNRIELLYERDDPITGVSTGFNDLTT